MKRAVVYYSLSGNTKDAAEKIAQRLGADLYRIDTAKPMPEGRISQILYGGGQASIGMCPDIKNVPKDLGAYQEIILGTPVWAGRCAPAINTLLEERNIKEQVRGVFTLSGSVKNDGCLKGLKKKLPNLTYSVSLADKSNPLVRDNEKKLEKFVREIKGEKDCV